MLNLDVLFATIAAEGNMDFSEESFDEEFLYHFLKMILIGIVTTKGILLWTIAAKESTQKTPFLIHRI